VIRRRRKPNWDIEVCGGAIRILGGAKMLLTGYERIEGRVKAIHFLHDLVKISCEVIQMLIVEEMRVHADGADVDGRGTDRARSATGRIRRKRSIHTRGDESYTRTGKTDEAEEKRNRVVRPVLTPEDVEG
jgi:hypothetical protein